MFMFTFANSRFIRIVCRKMLNPVSSVLSLLEAADFLQITVVFLSLMFLLHYIFAYCDL
jgi:hypothetical protein